jgi:hypothetical protein
MPGEVLVEHAAELRVAAAFVDVAGQRLPHHAGQGPAFDPGEGGQAVGQDWVEPEEDVLGLSDDIKISPLAGSAALT